MGSKSKKVTSSVTTQTQDIDTTSIGIEDSEGAIVNTGSGDVTTIHQTTDHGALDAARDIADSALGTAAEGIQEGRKLGESALDFAGEFGTEALRVAESGVTHALDFGLDVSRDALGFASQQAEKAQLSNEAALASLSSAIDKVGSFTRSDNTEAFTEIAKYIAIAIAVIGGAMFFARS